MPSALMLLVGPQEEHAVCKNAPSDNTRGNWLTQVHMENGR